MDKIPNSVDVMFVGDYFTLITTVQLDERLRAKTDVDDDAFAIRLGALWMGEHYGWDMIGASNEAGVVDKPAGEEPI